MDSSLLTLLTCAFLGFLVEPGWRLIPGAAEKAAAHAGHGHGEHGGEHGEHGGEHGEHGGEHADPHAHGGEHVDPHAPHPGVAHSGQHHEEKKDQHGAHHAEHHQPGTHGAADHHHGGVHLHLAHGDHQHSDEDKHAPAPEHKHAAAPEHKHAAAPSDHGSAEEKHTATAAPPGHAAPLPRQGTLGFRGVVANFGQLATTGSKDFKEQCDKMLRAAMGIGAGLATVSARLGGSVAALGIVNVAVFGVLMWWRSQAAIEGDVAVQASADNAGSAATAAEQVGQGTPTPAVVLFVGVGVGLLLLRAAYRCVSPAATAPPAAVRKAPVVSVRPKAISAVPPAVQHSSGGAEEEPKSPSQLEGGMRMPKEYAMFTPHVSGIGQIEALEPLTEQEKAQVQQASAATPEESGPFPSSLPMSPRDSAPKSPKSAKPKRATHRP